MALTPAIELTGIDATFIAEGDIKKYMGVKAGTNDNQVKPLGSGDTSGTIIVGIAQADADDKRQYESAFGLRRWQDDCM